MLDVAVTAPQAVCPDGTQPSTHVHRQYRRTLAYLHWATRPLTLHLRGRRFRSATPSCERQTFTERILQVAACDVQVTARLTALDTSIGLASGVLRAPGLALTRARRCPVAWGAQSVYNAYPWLLAGGPRGVLPQLGVVSPPGQAGGEALARSLVRSVMDAGVAVKGCRPADMSLRDIRSL